MQGNLLTAAQTDTIVKKTQIDKTRFIDGLLQSNIISPRDLATFCSETFGYPLMDLSVINESLIPDKLVDPKLMQTQRLVPIAKKGNKLALAVSDPTNNSAFDQVKFQTSLGIELIIVQHDALLKMLEKISKTSEQSLNDLSGDEFDLDFKEEDLGQAAAAAAADAQANEVDDAPIVKFLQKMLVDAINLGASDLHFEPFEKFYRIRFRVDGELREIAAAAGDQG